MLFVKTLLTKSPLFIVLLLLPATAKAQTTAQMDSFPVSTVFSAVGADFSLFTTKKYQYVCYYDADKEMTVAQRELTSKTWKKTKLHRSLSWDSHAAIAINTDKDGFIHISGNMHATPLFYLRSKSPENIDAFDTLPMTGKNEDKVTYPKFFKDKEGTLFFQYRNGRSGQGTLYWNKYDAEQKKWSSAFATSLFDGENETSVYSSPLSTGPDGYFYIVYMWRSTVIANTNHNVSVVRTKDMAHWENIEGKAMPLPIKWSSSKAIVDPVGPWNGLISNEFGISWDKEKRPCITYHKYDAKGYSQVYITRYEGDHWQIHQVSKWPDFTWDLDREGSISNDVGISRIRVEGDLLSVNYHHVKYGSGIWLLDPTTFEIKAQKEAKPAPYLAELSGRIKMNPNMVIHRVTDNTGHFVMQWQTLPPNQDAAPQPPFPAPTDLVVYDIQGVK